MKEHYGTVIPESSARSVTLGHAHCVREQSVASLQNRQECVGAGKRVQLKVFHRQ